MEGFKDGDPIWSVIQNKRWVCGDSRMESSKWRQGDQGSSGTDVQA